MVDVVNSAISNAVLLRSGGNGGASGGAGAPSVIDQAVAAGAPETPKAPYISPYISINFDYDKAVLQIRDADTGDVQEQFPTNSRLAEIRRAESQIERSQQVETAALEPIETAEKSSTQASDIISVQDVTSSAPANAPQFSPQIAVAALSAAAQSGGTPTASSTVSVSA